MVPLDRIVNTRWTYFSNKHERIQCTNSKPFLETEAIMKSTSYSKQNSFMKLLIILYVWEHFLKSARNPESTWSAEEAFVQGAF